MKRYFYLFGLLVILSVFMAGCGTNSQETEKSSAVSRDDTGLDLKKDNGEVDLVVWGAKEDEELLNQIFDSFKKEYQGQAEFNITYAAQGEAECKDALIDGLEEGADVFTFADDQLNTLVAAGALNPIENADAIKSENLNGAVQGASVEDTMYAYPLTADNGYFLYYNKKYITDKEAKTLDGILDAAAAKGKKCTMDWSSAWYVYSFFGMSGMEVGLNDDGITNFCTWNKKKGNIKGIDVARAMLDIGKHPGFLCADDEDFLAGVKDGSVVAGISGIWNSVAIRKAWKGNYGAVKLPTYTCAGKQVQMASFSGYKLIGVNAYTKHYAWASKLAEWISNEENQRLRFKIRGQGPSNVHAVESEEVQNSPAIIALIEQSEFSRLQRIGENYWEPVADFALNLAEGNPKGESLQKQLNEMVEKITGQ